jgi:hypothetical protein
LLAEAKEGRSRRRKILAMATYKARIPSCFLLLVMAFALVAFQGFHKIRDERLSNDIISEKNAEIERLREELQVPKSRNFFFSLFFSECTAVLS